MICGHSLLQSGISERKSVDFSIDPTLSSELEEALTNPTDVGGDSTAGSVQSSSVNMMDVDHEDLQHQLLLRDDDEVTLLCEVIGARNLKVHNEVDPLLLGTTDASSLRPYCIVKYDGNRIHRTAAAGDAGCNPIWVPTTRSLFLLKTTAKEMSRAHMNISIYAKQESALPVSLLQSSSNFLGQVNIDSSTILSHCDEERFEVNIEDEIGEVSSRLGKLALRFRIATPSDMKIVKMLNENNSRASIDESQRELVDIVFDAAAPGGYTRISKIYQKTASRPIAPIVTERDETAIAHSGFVNAVSNVFTRSITRDRKTGAKKIRVKPGPDPERKSETEYLTKHNLKLETRLPSKNWIEAGSGGLGKLYLEVLSCHDLPNMDSGGQLGNFTDSFCCAVYEDSCAMTDVIDDELNPHWLPWTQRAFCFNMMHPASILYLAVFDFDIGIGQHDPIGRVAVNVSNLQRDTVHTLKYSLYPSSNVTDRIAGGSITIRIRIECFDERAALLAALKPRPNIHVNVTKEKSFRVIRYTCFGEYDNEESFDLTVARSYVNEILEYKATIGYAIGDSLESLMFWRGQVEFFSVLVPVHSLVFYIMAQRLVESPQLIVPYTFLGIAWIMLANLTLRRHHPSPWQRCPSFLQYLHLLRTGKSSVPIKSVKEYEGAEEAKKYEEAWKHRLEEDRMIAARKAEMMQEISDIGDVNIHTQVSQGPIPLDLLVRLARYQAIIGRLCKKFRFVKIILSWEEGVVSFWVTAGFLGVGLVAMILPWGFILTWTGRIVVHGLLGPHMKIVDLYLRANKKEDSALKDLTSNFHIKSKIARRQREVALKIKDMKGLAFGPYSVQVPSFNLSRHFDRPLPESSSRVCRMTAKDYERSRNRVSFSVWEDESPWIPGQQLYGAMIPRPQGDEDIQKEEAAIGEKVLKLFQDCVQEIKDAEGLSEYEHKQLLKLGVRANSVPMAFGYEVTPLLPSTSAAEKDGTDSNPMETAPLTSCFSNKSLSSIDNPKACSLASSHRVSVKLTSDKTEFVEIRESRDVVLESDGTTTYCISEYSSEEEGMEVIGLGRYNTMKDTTKAFEEDLFEMTSNESLDVDDRLQQAFSSSERIQVAFYKPETEGVDIHNKLKEE